MRICNDHITKISLRARLNSVLLASTTAGLVATIAAAEQGPAFDCKKATHEIEVLVCQDRGLAALDRTLTDRFRAAHANLSADQKRTLDAEQRGWIKGRNDCWKDSQKRDCTEKQYTHRIVTLEARYGLAPVGRSTYYSCDDGKEDTLIFTPVSTDPPSANVVRGNESETLILDRSGSGSKYLGDFGIVFWAKGDDALVEWPQGTEFSCKRRP